VRNDSVSTFRLYFGQRFELFLGVAREQNAVVASLELIEWHSYVLGTHAQEATSAYEQIKGAAIGRDHDVFDIADFLVVLIDHAFAHQVLLGTPASDGFGAGSSGALGIHGWRSSAGRGRGIRGSARSGGACARCGGTDRKSTRLNSSHVKISYAVFCLKKKNSRWGAAVPDRPRQ